MKFATPLALAATLVLLPAAHAARPLTTDDAGVLGSGECEWELVAARPNGGGHGWSTTGTCGVTGGLQLIGTYGRVSDAGATSHSFAASAKKAFVDGGENGTSFTATATLNALKDTGSGWGTDSLALNLIASRPLAAGLIGHANLGVLRSRATGQAATTWNLAVEHTGESGIDLMAEAFGDDRSRSPWIAAGVRWNIAKNLNLNGSWGRQGGAVPARLLTLGIKLAF